MGRDGSTDELPEQVSPEELARSMFHGPPKKDWRFQGSGSDSAEALTNCQRSGTVAPDTPVKD